MFSIIKMLFPLAMNIIGSFVDKKAKNDETKKAFLGFVQAMEKESGASAKLRKSYKEQIKRLENDNKQNNSPL